MRVVSIVSSRACKAVFPDLCDYKPVGDGCARSDQAFAESAISSTDSPIARFERQYQLDESVYRASFNRG